MCAHRARRALAAGAIALSTVVVAAPARADTVTEWNGITANALVSVANQGAFALPHFAMVHGAMYDAVNAIDGRYQPYLVSPRARRWYSQDAAAATAAYRVLVDSDKPLVADPLALKAILDPLYAASLAAIPDGRAKQGGIDTGNAAAEAMIAARTNDGRFGQPGFPVGMLPGQWRPPLPPFTNDPGAWLKDVKPFLVRDSSQFAGRGPLRLTSRRYAREFDEVKSVGAVNSTTRTPDQTAASRFWGAANAIGTWSALFRDIAQKHGGTLADNARMFAMVYLTSADAAITTWAEKARHSFWRPITAIREAAGDGNPRTVADPAWLPLIPNPPYPDHPSGLSAFGGAAAGALQDFFGTDGIAFGTTNTANPLPVTRSYTSFSQAADEIVDARVWSGIHFRLADEVGVRIGRKVSRWRQQHYFRPARKHDHHGDRDDHGDRDHHGDRDDHGDRDRHGDRDDHGDRDRDDHDREED